MLKSLWQMPQYSTWISAGSARNGPGLNSNGSNFASLAAVQR